MPPPTTPQTSSVHAGAVWWRRRSSMLGMALGASLVAHALLMALAAVIAFGGGTGAAGQAAEPVEFAIVTDLELAQLQQEVLEDEVPEIPSEDAELPQVDLMEEQLDAEVSALIQDLGDVGSQIGAGDVSGAGLGLGGAGAGGASFFGIEATGNRFAYIVDTSGSMSVAGKSETLRAELSRSLVGLAETSSFFVSLFSNDAAPLGGEVKWTDATDRGKQWARRLVAAFEVTGGTNPSPAFTMVFALKPRPDAIYFMTDGQFPEEVATEIARLNRGQRIPIHCITFGSTEAEGLMRYIARQSGGTYTHIPGPGG